MLISSRPPPRAKEGCAMDGSATTFNARVRDGVHVIELVRADVLDPKYIIEFQAELLARIEGAPGAVFVIDFDSVRFLSSTALGALVEAHKACTKGGGTLCVAGASKEIVQALKLIRLHKLVRMYDTVDEAVAKRGV
ncbi:MAG: anti-sigma factor antagonist [Phycisphaerales bacterium]|nr:MAG: anti-sigma factor antagonist [Phycisphaerales bacterium]